MDIAANLKNAHEHLFLACERAGRDPSTVRLVGAVKGVAPDLVSEAMAAGLSDCGENVVQEAAKRIQALGPNAKLATWHLIGHLQTNKARVAAALFDIIQSVDSLRLAEKLSQHSSNDLQVFLEVNVAAEASKFGFQPVEVSKAIVSISRLPNLRLMGLMTVAPATSTAEEVRPTFRELRELANANGLAELSMGMTNDFEVAIEEGATMVRLGRAVFGERSQKQSAGFSR